MSVYQTFASNFTHNTLAATRTIQDAGGTAITGLHIYGIVLTNNSGSAQTITLEDADGADYVIYQLADGESLIDDVPRLVSNGLVISASTPHASMTFTLFHNNLQGAA
jgi:hypothetical protein